MDGSRTRFWPFPFITAGKNFTTWGLEQSLNLASATNLASTAALKVNIAAKWVVLACCSYN